MTVAAPAAAQRGLQGRQRQPFALHVDRDRRQQSRQSIFQRREAHAGGLCLGAGFLVTPSLLLASLASAAAWICESQAFIMVASFIRAGLSGSECGATKKVLHRLAAQHVLCPSIAG